ncbi:MAG: c-type cytochrome [Sulfuricurvum sp.]|jgi:flagellar motility protein MotE (MotC chaperone)|nr:c-type cytochrome [Sulfuricurvum sp.]MDP3021614.1 c-type cytochrome [Sulfuricurvum sp.]MDP3119987.1 c-type cytochrome [Sulfuricurvum sp.]
MKTRDVLVIGFAALLMSSYCSAKDLETPSMIYKNNCAACHGEKADGVKKLKGASGITTKQRAALDVASKGQYYVCGVALNTFTEKELVRKLQDIRSKNFDGKSYHAVMNRNLKKVEEREGQITDEKMAKYIYTTFGFGSK